MQNYVLDSIYINPTRFCNLRCCHCWLNPPFVNQYSKQDDELSVEEWINIARGAMPLGLNSIKLTGGEPLLRKDFLPFFEFCRKSGIKVIIETNGTLVDEKTARMFARTKVSVVAVSLDGANSLINDSFRGVKGAFKQAVSGIKNLIKAGLYVQVITCLHRANAASFGEFIGLLNSLGVENLKINIVNHMGRAEIRRRDKKLFSVKEVINFSRRLAAIKKAFGHKINLDVPAAFKKIDELGEDCTCGIFGILGILSTGEVSLCGIGMHTEDLIFGRLKGKSPNVIKAELKDIWENNRKLRQLRKDIPRNLQGVCARCLMKNRCLGKCRAESYYHHKHFLSPDWFCQQAFDKGFFPETRLIPKELKLKG
ncbi:MAG: radical SAM protein [Candidatus Omnitrophica bacterium]|nr:radical SAM protein [Candidatus Omnitrophota bacterium]